MKDIFEKIEKNMGPIGEHSKASHGYFTFPKLEGDVSPHMGFRGNGCANDEWEL
ncbi:MAG: 8-amino-7-oxononanoate synthase [Bacteroidota bacterium]|nr:8-amino-7-oxononanoate synthase [Bacteroidota bacterium]